MNGGKERRGESGRCESHPQVRAGSGLGVSTAEPEVAGGWPECSRHADLLDQFSWVSTEIQALVEHLLAIGSSKAKGMSLSSRIL